MVFICNKFTVTASFSCLSARTGLFRRLPAGTRRTPSSVLSSIADVLEQDGSEDVLWDKCINAASSNLGDSLLKSRRSSADGAEGEDGVQVEEDCNSWHISVARMVIALKKAVIREFGEEKLLMYMIEWCDSVKKHQPGCCYDDCVVVYPNNGAAPAQQVT